MFPPAASFLLDIGGEEREIRLRKFALRDHIFCINNFGGDIGEVLERNSKEGSCDISTICSLVYNQIIPEDTIFFGSKNCKAIDADGESHDMKIGGTKLLEMLIDNEEVFNKMMGAFQVCILSSMPIVEKKN